MTKILNISSREAASKRKKIKARESGISNMSDTSKAIRKFAERTRDNEARSARLFAVLDGPLPGFPSADMSPEVEIPSIAVAKDGFWIDRSGKYDCPASKITFWIPPGQVRYVRRVEFAGEPT